MRSPEGIERNREYQRRRYHEDATYQADMKLRAKAQGRARTRLVKEEPERYRVLYLDELSQLRKDQP